MKKLLIAGAVVIVILVAVVFLTLSNLGPLVKKTVNTVGPQITKTDVEVADVSISIFSGEAKIKNFLLGNPKGFKSSHAMTIGSVFVDIDEESITKNPIIINKIEILAPDITYEKIKSSDNFQTLLKNVRKSANTEKKAAKKAGNDSEKQGTKIIINNVIVKDGKVNLTMAALAGKEITALLPDIHLKDIGKKKDGATPAEAFEQIFSSIYGSIRSDSVTQILNDGLKQFGNLKGLDASDLKAKTASKAVDAASKGVKSATQGLKSLFKE